jgi:hypothetical protein
MKKLGQILDNILLGLIFLSIVQIIVDDLSIIYAFSERIGVYMIWAGVIFDLVFTIEFFVRMIISLKNKNFKNYFLYQKGWIDFAASLPLLLLNSGPSFVSLITSGAAAGSRSIINVLKVIRAIRVTRILRLLRCSRSSARSRIRNPG